MTDVADETPAEAVRLRIVAAIGRDSALITGSDKERHLVGAAFLGFFAGKLFLHCVGVAVDKISDKLEDAAADKVVDVAWAKSVGMLKAIFCHGEPHSSDQQVKRIGEVTSGLAELGRTVEAQYLAAFLEAGRSAVEARLVADNLPPGKAKRIAAAVAAEVHGALNPGHA